MTTYAGVRQILVFNWPWYAGALAVTVVAVAMLAGGIVAGPFWVLAMVALALADGWLLLSLVVSHAIYDRSAIARGEWLRATSARSVVICHFGQDEAAVHVARWLPAASRQTFDLYEPSHTGSPSLRRARALAKGVGASPAALDALPIADGSSDLVVLAFAAHEVRDAGLRVRLFREMARILDSSGRLLVVEHLRDGWNLLAYGPGVFHFLSRRTWLTTFALAGLQVVGETRLTPWVRRFELRRPL